MNKLVQYIITGVLILTLTGCEKFLEPNVVDGKIDEELVWDTRALAEGVLLRAYQMLPSYYATSAYNLDIPAGDAVTNVLTSSVHRMSNGGWTTRYNPINIYESTYDALMQINDFLEHVDMVQWADTSKPLNDSILRVRLKGEAYGLRAFYNARLLQRIGGVADNGELLGFPIVTEVIDDPSQAQLARNTYAQCVQHIFDDCDKAIALLPKTWTDTDLSVEEAKVMGAKYANRINGLSVMLIKARTALMAASEAYSQSGVTMETAAQYAADIINFQGGIANVATDPLQFWLQNESYLTSYNEIFWHTGVGKTNNREKSAYPPSLFG
ncbi:MAG: RagB/SusD family nutrient uptake outer membrane protein, partial [Bacteroidales bacterium]|nr:RagB/SusD family nutrient uptake outer membrane protein [Bacteroidales bacterium]